MSRTELLRLGYSDAAIRRAVEAGRLYQLHRGIFAVGHLGISGQGHCLGAVLACGDCALLSHGSAAWLWGIASSRPSPPHVTVPRRGHVRATVRLHHSTILTPLDCDEQEGIPVTAVPRTLLDTAIERSVESIEWTLERSERRGLLDIGAIDGVLARAGRHPGRKPLGIAMRVYREPVGSKARQERLLLDAVKRAGLSRPSVNLWVAGGEVDLYWARERFAVEVDGWETHRTRAAFERDPLRLEDLKLAGIDGIRVTARRVEREPDKVAARLGVLLARRRASLAAQK